MQQSDVEEDRRNEPPDFAVVDLKIGFHAESVQRGFVRRSAGKRHQDEDDDIQAEERIGGDRASSPEGANKVEILFFDHDKSSLTPTWTRSQFSYDLTRRRTGILQCVRLEGNCCDH